MNVPVTMYVALGAVAAALVAGFFSFLNMVSSKENKVSEFRQSWIDGLRQDIATYHSALGSLIRFRAIESLYENDKEWYEKTECIYRDVAESLAKIQLRLNPHAIKKYPDSHEAKLLSVVLGAKDLLNADKFSEAFEKSNEIRTIAAPFLKEEWERVKVGEMRYRKIRDSAEKTIQRGIVFLVAIAILALIASATISPSDVNR